MSSQTILTTRRKFLERSMLGTGSLLLSSSLLQSCMKDHNFPNPDPNPPLFLPKFDWNDTAKMAITTAVEAIPEVGEILGPLIDIFWPKSQEDVWGEIKEKVEALVDQKISTQVYQQVSDDLAGLKNSLTLYLNYLKSYNDSVTDYKNDPTKPAPNPTDLRTQWMITRNSFFVAQPHFQSAGYEMLLMPLFVHFCNLYLALLRDGALKATSWGMSDGDQKQIVADLTDTYDNSYIYAINILEKAKQDLVNKTKTNYHLCEPFRTVNKFRREMILTCYDFMNMWEYFDVTTYPNGVPAGIQLEREIYSDPFGTADNSGNINTGQVSPRAFPTNVTVWGGDRIQSVQLTYPAGKGPDGVTTTKRMGYPNGNNQPPLGGVYNLRPDNPIVWARCTYGDIVNSMQFGFHDGTATQMMGAGGTGGLGSKDTDMIGFPLEALSSIHINGFSGFYYSADVVVFGFYYWESPTAKLNAIRDLYVKAPEERSAADMAKRFPKHAIPANLITEELKAARKAHWESIKARAEALK